jgi:thymidylate synthase (FAD)
VKHEFYERDQKLINFLIKHDHTSPFEHNQLSFRVKTPLFVARQWMRHRMNSYNEISYRYVKAPLEFYIPPYWRHQDKNNKQASYGKFADQELYEAYKASIDHGIHAYEKLLEAGVAREQARGLLPLCTYTEYIYTCNLHSFMHFVNLRIQSDAQYEIRMYAEHMLGMAQPYFPASLKAFMEKHNLSQ